MRPNIGTNDLERIMMDQRKRIRNVETQGTPLGFSGNGIGGAFTQTNNGVWTASGGVAVTAPAGARIARVHGNANARAVANAACYWRLRVVDSGSAPNIVITPDIRSHNQSDPANAMGFAACADYIAIGVVTQAWVDINVDTGGTGVFIAVSNVWVEWIS